MSRGPVPVMNNLHNISEQLAEATKQIRENGTIQSMNPVAFGQTDKAEQTENKNARILDAALLRRHEDYLKSRKDLEIRLNQSLVQMQAEYDLISARADLINAAFQDLQKRLDQLEQSLPADAEMPQKQSELAARCNQLEVIRLESIRSIARFQANSWTSSNAPGHGSGPANQSKFDIGSLSFGFLFLKGLALFLPLILALLISSLIIAAGYLVAFGV